MITKIIQVFEHGKWINHIVPNTEFPRWYAKWRNFPWRLP